MSTKQGHPIKKSTTSKIATVLRRPRGANVALLESGAGRLSIDRDLPQPPHGARIRLTRIDDEDVVRGFELITSPVDEVVAGRVDKRVAQAFLTVESAVREARVPLDGAENLMHGQYVRAKISKGRAGVVESLGDMPDAALRIASIIDEFQLPTEFSAEVLSAAEKITGPRDLTERRDLRGKAFVTIDGADAKDFDDAVLAERRGPAFRLFVAIADVSSHVAPGSTIDQEARARGTSVYFPGRVLPMLPHRLSDDLCSLRPDVDRAVLVCEMLVGAKGQLQSAEFYAATIRSQARLIYGDVAEALDSQAFPKNWNRKVVRNLSNLSALHESLHSRREIRGALDFASRELIIELDLKGQVCALKPPERTVAHRLIEECMILANVAAASALRQAKQPFLARVHEQPSELKLQELRVFLNGRGLKVAGGNDPSPKDYADLLSQVEERPDSAAIQLAILQSLQQAHYAPSDRGHFGLALQDYAHFTSPIRRYPDLLVHRALYAMIGGPELPNEDWQALGQQCSNRERLADQASWGVIEAMKLDYLADKVGETFKGGVTGVAEFGLFVELEDFNISGLLHISQLGNDYFVYESDRKCLRGRKSGQTFVLGQVVSVRIAAAEPATRKLDLTLSDRPRKPAPSHRRRKR